MRSSFSPSLQCGFALEVDGLLKTCFDTLEGATTGAREIIRRFPNLRVRIYDFAAKASLDVEDT